MAQARQPMAQACRTVGRVDHREYRPADAAKICHEPQLQSPHDHVERLGRYALLPPLWADWNGYFFRTRLRGKSRAPFPRRQPVEWLRRGGIAPRSPARYSMRDL